MDISDAASGWAGWALAEFGSSVNPITTRGADYTASPSGFENPAASLDMKDFLLIFKHYIPYFRE